MSCSQISTLDADAKLGKDSEEPNTKKVKLNDETDSPENEAGEMAAEIAEEEEDAVTDTSKIDQHEESLGIAERINKGNKRFRGILKQITTDFIVNEIDLDNRVVYLNDLSQPSVPENEGAGNQSSAELVKASSQEEHEQSMREILGEAKYQELVEFLSSNSSTTSFRIEAPSKLNMFISTKITSLACNSESALFRGQAGS